MNRRAEIKKILKYYKQNNLRFSFNGNHYKVYFPNNKIVTVSSSPSDNHALKNIQRDFKRNGYCLKNGKNSKYKKE